MSDPSRPAVDVDQAVEQVGHDADLFAELVDLFGAERELAITEIEAGLGASDAARVERAAHRLKGSLGTLAAIPARELAAAVEAAGRASDLAAASDTLPKLLAELDRVGPALRDALASLRGAA
jgi:HPt (histidine-containing phosphotransfer) domain-containing protein